MWLALIVDLDKTILLFSLFTKDWPNIISPPSFKKSFSKALITFWGLADPVFGDHKAFSWVLALGSNSFNCCLLFQHF